MMKVLFIVLVLMVSCKIKPDGKDTKGYFRYVDSCVVSHNETNVSVLPSGVPIGGDLYLVTSDVCDSSVYVKRYIQIDKVDFK